MKKTVLVFNGFEAANTTPVPDVLFDELLTELSGAELKVMLYIIRRTLGFKKTTDAISLTQFEKGITTQEGKVLDRGCGLNRETICRALQSLGEKGCIQSIKRTATKRDNDTTLYSIRFKGEARVVGKSDHVPSRKSVLPPLVGKSDYGSRKTSEKVVGKSDPQETVIQDTVKQETVIREREEVANATARAFLSSQENNPQDDETQKRKAQVNSNRVQEPPAPTKPKLNVVTPKRPKQEPVTMPVSPEAQRILDDWTSLFKRKVAINQGDILAAEHLVQTSISKEDLGLVRLWLFSTDNPNKPWYRKIGVCLADIDKKYTQWLSLQEAPPDRSEQHVVSSFGTPGFDFASEFYPSEAEKRAYAAAQEAKVSV